MGEEVEKLTEISCSRTSEICRKSNLLVSYEGKSDSKIARELSTHSWNFIFQGRPPEISVEARTGILSLACIKPKDVGYPHELWTQRLLAK